MRRVNQLTFPKLSGVSVSAVSFIGLLLAPKGHVAFGDGVW